MKTLIKNTTAYVGKDFDRYDDIDILIEGDKIIDISEGINEKNAEIIDGSDFFVTPGFINAHFHPSQQLNRALGIGLSHDEQMDLLHATDNIKKKEDKYWMSFIAILESLKSGTTCFQSVGSEIDSQVPVFDKMGVRAVCVLVPKDILAESKKEKIRAKVWDTEERIEKAEESYKKYNSDLLKVHFGVVNVRYASDNLIKGMLGLAEKYNTGFHMHASEGNIYVNKVKERTGNRPIEHLHKKGFLNNRFSLAHMTKLNKKETDYLSKAGASVVHCPRANSYVAVGVCPVKELLDSGVNVCLGSDAAINNNSNEVRGEARSAFDKISDKYEKADLIDYKTLFKMLTINGAKAIMLEKEIGSIEKGKRADLVLWSKNDLPFIPGFNHIADLIFTESCMAHTVIINGKKVLDKYKLVNMDEETLKKKAREISERYYNSFKEKVAKHL